MAAFRERKKERKKEHVWMDKSVFFGGQQRTQFTKTRFKDHLFIIIIDRWRRKKERKKERRQKLNKKRKKIFPLCVPRIDEVMTQRGIHVVFVQRRRCADKVRVVHDVSFEHLFRVHVFQRGAFFVVDFDAGGAEQELRRVVDRSRRLVGRPAVFGDDIADVERRVELRPVFERLVDVLVRAVLVASFGKRRAHDDEIDDDVRFSWSSSSSRYQYEF